MSENVQVSYVDLTNLNRTINATLGVCQSVAAQTTQLRSDVTVVNNKVNKVSQNVVSLWSEFRVWVKEQRNANNLQRALTEIVRIRQELEQKFGKHAEARTRLQGILDSAGTGLLREFTIASCSEQVMLDTPKYWLAPCLVALAAWISNDKELANKAVRVALDRDVEKSSLLFALVCRRTIPQTAKTTEEKAVQEKRTTACFTWLKCYFECQDPNNVTASVIVLIDSWKNNIFGEDKKGICETKFDEWMTELGKQNNFEKNQKATWNSYFQNYCVSTAAQNAILARVCPEFPRIDAYLSRIQTADRIQAYFNKILDAEVDKRDLVARLDEQLNSLISEYDKEEEGLRDEETACLLTKKFNGDKAKVDQELAKIRAKRKPTDRVSFAKRLEEVVRSTDAKYVAARKTAISETFLGKYIKPAYEEYITAKKPDFPSEITIKDKEWMGWSGKTKDGANRDELTKSYKSHMDNLCQKELDAVPTKGRKNNLILAIVSIVLGIILAIAVQPVVGLIIALAGGGFFFYRWNAVGKQIQAAKDAINARYKALIDAGTKLILAALKQWQDVQAEVNVFESKPEKATLKLSK